MLLSIAILTEFAWGGLQQSGLFVGGTEMTEFYLIPSSRIQAISDKADDLTRWLAQNASNCQASQKHLEEGSIEQAYWHYGYVSAIKDILATVRS